jgi:hypothetical protein
MHSSARVVSTCAPVVVALALAASANASVVVRDAIGGQTAAGGTPGLYLTGTGGNVTGMLDGIEFKDPAVGMWDLEADYGGGFESLRTFCISPYKTVTIPLYEEDPNGLPGFELVSLAMASGFSAAEVDLVQRLWFNAIGVAGNGQVEAGAFQVLLWEMALDDGLSATSFTTGLVRLDPSADALTASVTALANDWIGKLTGAAPEWSGSIPMFALIHPESQDLLTPIPEPGALALVLAGMALGLRRLRR